MGGGVGGRVQHLLNCSYNYNLCLKALGKSGTAAADDEDDDVEKLCKEEIPLLSSCDVRVVIVSFSSRGLLFAQSRSVERVLSVRTGLRPAPTPQTILETIVQPE